VLGTFDVGACAGSGRSVDTEASSRWTWDSHQVFEKNTRCSTNFDDSNSISPRTTAVILKPPLHPHSLLEAIAVQVSVQIPPQAEVERLRRDRPPVVIACAAVNSNFGAPHNTPTTSPKPLPIFRKNYHHRARSSLCCCRAILRYVRWRSGFSGARPLTCTCEG
jgi:hypothetical protein